MSIELKERLKQALRQKLIDDNGRCGIKKYNQFIQKYKYLLVSPMASLSKGENSILGSTNFIFGFSDNIKITQNNDKDIAEAYENVKCSMFLIHFEDNDKIQETVIIESSELEAIPIEEPSWEHFINSPKIRDNSFDIMQKPFLDYFRLEETENNYITDYHFSFNDYFFKEENKPEQLELRTIVHEVDDNHKYGDIITTIFWKSEFIGWIHKNGKWLETISANTVDIQKWNDMMQHLFVATGYNPALFHNGVSICDMNTSMPDDVTLVPGFLS